MPFSGPLRLEYIDGRKWKLLEPLTYFTQDGTRGIDVHAGFITDFASVPRFFWRILPPTGKYGAASVIHDFLYRYGIYTRAEADRIFLEAMEELGVSWLTRRTMYRAVRLFGRGSYTPTPEAV